MRKNIFRDFAEWVDSIPTDKKIHFVVGFVITILLSFFLGYGMAFVIALAIAGIIELFEKFTAGRKPEIKDFAYTASGVFAAEVMTAVFTTALFFLFG